MSLCFSRSIPILFLIIQANGLTTLFFDDQNQHDSLCNALWYSWCCYSLYTVLTVRNMFCGTVKNRLMSYLLNIVTADSGFRIVLTDLTLNLSCQNLEQAWEWIPLQMCESGHFKITWRSKKLPKTQVHFELPQGFQSSKLL